MAHTKQYGEKDAKNEIVKHKYCVINCNKLYMVHVLLLHIKILLLD